ncbi:adhesin, partial [Haemophilus influenzae]|uniref:beta strand repeat-containing protein n=1 Tax=Haemophilus influenzae TaxID=727 RepID=UPI000E34FA19
KEGEAEIGGVISAQNQQAKGGKLMITGDKVTLKTGAVIDLSGKEGGETYLGGDERGEGKNGIQLAKKTSLEKGSTINVSGKEKGGRAIVWGDIALIDGNINAQGKDIAKTGGFVETSGHDLFIKDNAIVDAKEWLLDPEEVTISANPVGRNDDYSEDASYTGSGRSFSDPKRNKEKTTLTNTTLENILERGSYVNITATRKINVTSAINLSSGSLTLYTQRDGVEINGDITSNKNGNLTIKSGSWVDVHKNITLGQGFLNITARGSVAFEGKGSKARNAADAQITAQGTITNLNNETQLRLNNVSINGTGNGLNFISTQGNFSHQFDGTINVSGNVTINQTIPNIEFWKISRNSYWNVTSFNLKENSNFTFIKYANSNRHGDTGGRDLAGVIFNAKGATTSFNVERGSSVNFTLKSTAGYRRDKMTTATKFLSNISVSGGGNVSIRELANTTAGGINISSSLINVSGGSSFTLSSSVRKNDAFKISKDLTINATGSNFTLKQTADTFADGYGNNAINTTHNIHILGGNVTLGGQNSSSRITGNITIEQTANVILEADNSYNANNQGSRTINLGNLTVKGNLSLTGENANINGNLSVSSGAIFKGKTRSSLNITNTFTNDGDAEINITQGVVKLGNITNGGNLNITTNAKSNQKSVINGNITNKKGALNITNNGKDTEIQIGGNISQKEGNLTISSDKINITKQITIKKGVNGENSDSDTKSQANLTIKTKELKLTENLNISGFNKAEITAKNGRDLTIGNSNDGNSGAEAKAVTFNNVKDSKISANGHNVTLNSKVETSGNTDNTGGSSGNNAGLTINAKNVTVSNDITSHKTVNITASEKLTTKADATINATNGNVKVTTQTGDIKGQVKSTSGSVTIAASGDTLNVSNVSGNAVTITADKGKLTAQAGSTIKATTGEANITSATGTIDGTVSGGTVNVTASSGSLTVGGDAKINATEGAATLTATKGTLTTVKGSNIDANKGTLVINAKDAKLDGEASGNRTEVNATNASGSGSVTAATSSSVNITGDLNTINGLNIISENGRNTVRLRGKEIDVKYIQPGVASVEEVIEAKRVLEKVKDLSDEERETLAKLGVSA